MVIAGLYLSFYLFIFSPFTFSSVGERLGIICQSSKVTVLRLDKVDDLGQSFTCATSKADDLCSWITAR